MARMNELNERLSSLGNAKELRVIILSAMVAIPFLLYTADLGELAASLDMSSHFYADVSKPGVPNL